MASSEKLRQAPPPLLIAIDAAVARDAAISGLSGDICIGVRDKDEDIWWRAEFKKGTRCSFANAPTAGAGCKILLTVEAAHSILATGELPDGHEPIFFDGDPLLLNRFVERYLVKQNLMQIRFASASNQQG